MEDQSHQIHSAFTNTSYIVSLEKEEVLHIGDSGEVLTLLLPGVKSWAFITAWNPLPDILTLPENLARNEALAQMLTEKGYRYHPGVGRSDAGDWQEDSFLIENIGYSEAMLLAKQFGQLAFVFWEEGEEEVRLCYSS